MIKTNPDCTYITLAEMKTANEQAKGIGKTKKRKEESKLSKYLINNAFVDPDVPLSDEVRGVYGITPPELLHTTHEGVTKYVTEAISKLLSQGNKQLAGKAPHERQGNLFILLCISHCRDAKLYSVDALTEAGVNPNDFFRCLKLYLAMEEWFHDNNPVEEVEASRVMIVEVLGLIQKAFVRNDGQKWHIPKMHGLTKMQHYISLFGSGINFFGGPGESCHKKLVKDTGNNTQKRID
ncbi:hypothetical protein ACHAWF_002949, partial [Thalassiosira exigua]